MALVELARFLPRQEPRNRYLRSGMRARDNDMGGGGMYMHRTGQLLLHPGVELPPGASFDPDPQTSYAALEQALSGDGDVEQPSAAPITKE